jgi:hypothetical protein
MTEKMKYDFSGYATKTNLKCSDGRTIQQDAFLDNDGQIVPLVWQHLHNEPENILGHALLENRPDGVYAYCSFNGTEKAQAAKELIKHGDIKALSIYANSLVEKAKNVIHGVIREVSLVIAGANQGAFIDNLSFEHADGSITQEESEAVLSANEQIDEIFHADPTQQEDDKEDNEEETVADVFATFTDKQKTVVYAMIGKALDTAEDMTDKDSEDEGNDDTEEIKQSDITPGEPIMKNNIFDQSQPKTEGDNTIMHKTLTRDGLREIFTTAVKSQSTLKNAFLAHGFDSMAEAYEAYIGPKDADSLKHSITDIGYLFPDYKASSATPNMLTRKMDWVSKVFGAAKKIPFTRVKTLVADLTEDQARALGYVKGNEKVEQVFALLKRTTDPQTVYKKQKIDRDDMLDITDFDIVLWLRSEMRMMLEEELARAVIIGDGRSVASDDKISETKIRPIAKDDDLYTVHTVIEATSPATDATTSEIIDGIVRARKDYRGAGNPTLFTNADIVADMLLLKDSTGRRIYNTLADLAAALRVKEIVEVPVLETVVNSDTDDVDYSELVGVIVNMVDYSIGADKGGAITMFDDFDIDFNQHKYLIETRISGALTVPHSALAIWAEKAEPADASPSGASA